MKKSVAIHTQRLLAVVALSAIISSGALPALAQNQSLPPMNYGQTGYGQTPNYNYNDGSSGGFQTYGNSNNGYQQQPSYNNYSAPQNNYQQSQPYQGRVSTVPAGTFLSASLMSPVSSEFTRVGDRFNATLGSPITGSDGSVIVPAGSQLEGQVVMVKSAGRTGRNGELDVRFTAAVLGNGQRVPLSARIKTDDGTGVIRGGSTKGRLGRAALNTGVGAGLGAALGTAMGPLSGGSVGRGAIYGTAIGGGLGAAKAMWNKGDEAVLEAGQPLNVTLDQPLTISPPLMSNPNPYSGGYNNYGGSYTADPYGNNGGGYNQYNQYGQ